MNDQIQAELGPQSKKHLYIILGIVILAFIVLFIALNSFQPVAMPKEEEAAKPPEVSVIEVQPSAHRVTVTSRGTVMAKHEVNLVSQVGGQITQVSSHYVNGGFIKAGEMLLAVDERDYRFALVRAESEVARAAEALALEKGRARQAKREWRDLGNAEANSLFLREPQLAAAQAAYQAAVANRDMAALNLERTVIRAPFDGVVSAKLVDIGQYVAPGISVAKVFNTDLAEVRLPLTDTQAGHVELPMSREANQRPSVLLTGVSGGKSYEWQAQVVRTEASIDVNSRVTYAVAEVKNPYLVEGPRPPLQVGLFVKADIVGREYNDVVLLPRKALQKFDQLILVDAENRLFFKTVEVLQSDGVQIMVRGLEPGDKVLVDQVPHAVTGAEVNPVGEGQISEKSESDPQTNEGQSSEERSAQEPADGQIASGV